MIINKKFQNSRKLKSFSNSEKSSKNADSLEKLLKEFEQKMTNEKTSISRIQVHSLSLRTVCF